MPSIGLRGTSSRGYFGGGTKPFPPTITSSSPGNTFLSLSFNPPIFNGGLSITRYEYSVSIDSGVSWSPWALASSNTTPPTSPVSATGLTNGQSYRIKLRAINNLGAGDESNVWTSNTTPRTVPSAPTITSLARGYRKLTISFSSPTSDGGSSITDYQYSKDDGVSWTSMAQSNTNNFLITSLSDFKQYTVRVRAVNAAGEGDMSAPVSAYTAGAPNQPSSGSAGSNGVGSSALTWTAPDDNASAISDYIVQWSTSSTFASNVNTFNDGVSTSASATVTGLAAATTHYFRVAAVNEVGQGGWSSIFSSTTAGVPSAPATPTSSSGDKSFSISWSAPTSNGGSSVTGYKVRVSTNSDMSGSSWEDVGNVTSKTWNSRTNGTTYYGQVLAYNAVGDSSGSGVSTGRTPSFAAPAFSANGDYNSKEDPYTRRLTWSVDPTNIVGTSTTYVYVQWIKNSLGADVTSSEELVATYSGTGADGGYSSYFINSGVVVASEQYRMRADQTDGDYTATSGWITVNVKPRQEELRLRWDLTSDITVYTTGTFNVNGGSFYQVSTQSMPGVNTSNKGDVQYRIKSFEISATGVSSSSASTSTRYFRVQHSGTATTLDINSASETSTNSNTWAGAGNVSMTYTWNITDIDFGNAGAARVAVDGLGGSSWSPNINVVITAKGDKQTRTEYTYYW